MARNVFFVFSLPPAGVSDEEFSQWYERHAEQIVEVPGFLAARRYWLEPAVSGRPPTIYRHLSLYVLEGDSAGPLAELERRVGTGEVTLEDWFGDIRFASFDGEALE